MNNYSASEVCKALGDPNRLQIIQLLATGEKCACKLLEAFNITQPTLSHHMKILCDCNLVAFRKEGKWTHYSLNCTAFKEFKNFITSITCKQSKSSTKEGETSGKQNKNSTCDCCKTGGQK